MFASTRFEWAKNDIVCSVYVKKRDKMHCAEAASKLFFLTTKRSCDRHESVVLLPYKGLSRKLCKIDQWEAPLCHLLAFALCWKDFTCGTRACLSGRFQECNCRFHSRALVCSANKQNLGHKRQKEMLNMDSSLRGDQNKETKLRSSRCCNCKLDGK